METPKPTEIEAQNNRVWAIRSIVIIPFILPFIIAFYLYGLTLMVTWWKALKMVIGG